MKKKEDSNKKNKLYINPLIDLINNKKILKRVLDNKFVILIIYKNFLAKDSLVKDRKEKMKMNIIALKERTLISNKAKNKEMSLNKNF